MTPEERDKLYTKTVTFMAEHVKWLQGLQPGDEVIRMLGSLAMKGYISKVTDKLLYFTVKEDKYALAAIAAAAVLEDGDPALYWTFSRNTGAEIDEDLGWDEQRTGSYIISIEAHEAAQRRESFTRKVWEHYKTNDPGTVAEELLQDVDPLEEKCKIVRQAVQDGDITIIQALEAYGVTKEQYINYLKKIYRV